MVERQRFPLNWKELLALVLAVVSMRIDDTAFVFFCLLLAVILGCWGTTAHHIFRRATKILICIAIFEVALALFLFLRNRFERIE
jgi:formate hydrogenlyase subunit 4